VREKITAEEGGRERKRHVFWLIIIRMVALTSLFVSAVVVQYSTSSFFALYPFYYLIFLSYFLSLVYFIFYLTAKNYTFQTYMQIIIDLFLITGFVYISGGLNGSFYFLYIFGIIAASIILSHKAAYFIAALSALIFGVLVDFMYFEVIPYFSPDQYMELTPGVVFHSIFLAWVIFFVIAFLTNYLANKLRMARNQLRKAQRELEIRDRMAIAGEVSANIAHEVRNPLAAISGAVQVLKDELKLNTEQKKLMGIVLRESRRASQSIEQFLDFAAPKNQVFSLIEVSAILREILTILKGSGELNENYRLEGNYNSTEIPYYGNINQFKQIFWNLLRNSLKAMPEGGTLSINFDLRGDNEFQIRIADDGKGMTSEDKERIFEPFYSGFGTGRGLGMPIVYRIVDDYEGKIAIDSEIDKGTEVTITLPLRSPIREV
jgi:two-component system sensor histidine kinase PilS (NtrC family)